MPTLAFEVQDSGGNAAVREVVADDVSAAVSQLAGEGLRPLSYEEVVPDRASRRRVPVEVLTTFYRSLAASLAEGVPLVDSLSLIARESQSPALQVVVSDIARSVNQGTPLHRAMAQWPTTFSAADIAVVRSGTQGGTLPEALEALADHREVVAGLSRRVAAALVYPVVVTVVVGGVLAFFMTCVLPQFTDLFEELGIDHDELPVLTLAVVWIGAQLSRLLVWFAIPVVSLALLVRLYVRSASGQLTWDYVRLRTPVVGMIAYYVSVCRATSLLSVMLKRGVSLVESLRFAADSAGNAMLSSAFRIAAERVALGDRLSAALRDTELLPPGLPWRVAVAERAGDLAASFAAAAESYREQAEMRMRAFAAILEPVLLIVVGLMVGLVIIGCLAPLVGVISQLSGS